MMETAPITALVVPQSQFLLQLLVVALNTPTTHDRARHLRPRRVLRQGAEPVMCGLIRPLWPFDYQPFLLTGPALMRSAHAHPGKARTQQPRSSLTPTHTPPRLSRQLTRHCRHRNRLVISIALEPLVWPASWARPGRVVQGRVSPPTRPSCPDVCPPA